MMSTSVAYLAGVIDSDGCITIKRRRVATAAQWNMSPVIFVRQVSDEAITLLQQRFGGRTRIHAASTPNGRPLFHWEVSRREAVAAAKQLLPYLRIKRRQAEIVIAFGRFLSDPRLRCRITYFKWEKDEPTYTVHEAAALKGVGGATVYQAISNKSIPSRLIPGRGHGTRLIPKRFWDSYNCKPGRSLPAEYIAARDSFRAQIHALNGPTKGKPTQ